jgi:hypothetical protein
MKNQQHVNNVCLFYKWLSIYCLFISVFFKFWAVWKIKEDASKQMQLMLIKCLYIVYTKGHDFTL